MKFGVAIVVVVVMLTGLAGCQSGGLLSRIPSFSKDKTPATQTQGGEIDLTIAEPLGETITVKMSQPSNAQEPATVTYVWPDGTKWIEITTGTSRKDDSAAIWANAGQYDLFIYIGAGVFALGLAILIASFWFPLIPKTAGILMMAGGGLTAYMTTALEDYGWAFLACAVLGGWHWFTHMRTAKKHPIEFDRKAQKEIKNEVTNQIRAKSNA